MGRNVCIKDLYRCCFLFPNDARKAFIVPQYEDGDQMEGVWVSMIMAEDGTLIPSYQYGACRLDGSTYVMTKIIVRSYWIKL